jgi:hypothetical protein
MSDESVQEADRRLEEALEARGARDPREFYRQRLRDLKGADPAAYAEAVAYYRDTLIPEVASGAEPLAAWTRYGRRLAEATAAGRTVSVDGTGVAHPWTDPPDPEHLVLHLPDDAGRPALLVGLPAEPSPAQRATYDVLVSGRQKPRD